MVMGLFLEVSSEAVSLLLIAAVLIVVCELNGLRVGVGLKDLA
jgi:CRISPR/Cas system-associated endonuclease Cas1